MAFELKHAVVVVPYTVYSIMCILPLQTRLDSCIEHVDNNAFRFSHM